MNSMTGFGQASGEWVDPDSGDTWLWATEAKSVNHKSLDVRVRASGQFEALERPIKAKVPSAFSRGAFQVSVQYDRQAALDTNTTQINVERLGVLADQIEALDGRRPTALELLSIRGVLDQEEEKSSHLPKALPAALGEAVLASVDQALSDCASKRAEEGNGLKTVLGTCLDDMAVQLGIAANEAATVPAALKLKLEKNLDQLGVKGVEPERVAQEIALMAAKADVTEEVERFQIHLASAKQALVSDEPVGRKLEFLAQEFNREANTLCSKSGSPALTNAGLALKGLIDQWREQAANVE